MKKRKSQNRDSMGNTVHAEAIERRLLLSTYTVNTLSDAINPGPGLLTLRQVRRLPSDQWPASRVRDHMVPLSGQIVVPPDAPVDQVMAKLEDGGTGRVLVAEDGEVVGIITSSDLTRWLRRWRTIDSRALDSRAR